MRGEASRIADRTSRDTLAPKLRGVGEDSWRIGEELFFVTQLLDTNARVETALTDPSRPLADKKALLNNLIGDQAHSVTMEILTDLVDRKWSRARDIANAVEDFGVDAMMYYADYKESTLRVSIELAQLHSALLKLPVFRSKLYDTLATPQSRVSLLHGLLDGSNLNAVTVRLAEHATANLRKRRYLSTLQWLINKFSRHMGESMITITTAAPLTTQQVERLLDVYGKKLDRKVHINSVVDPSVIGGMRIQVGDEVTDNTVVAQLRQLKRTIQAGSRQ